MQRHADAMEQARLQSEGTIENLRKKLNTLQDVRETQVYQIFISKRNSYKMEKSVRLTVFNKSNNNIINNYNRCL